MEKRNDSQNFTVSGRYWPVVFNSPIIPKNSLYDTWRKALNRPTITALVPTFNVEKYIADCLESLAWVDRILVVDSFSTDRTLDICRQYTDCIYQHEYINSAAQKNWALDLVDTEWVIQVDSDERVESQLAQEILSVLPESNEIDGYFIRIKNLVWGKWTRCCGLYPCSQIRLFRPDKGRWSDREVHARLQGIDRVGHLQNHFIHLDWVELSEELQQFSRQVVVWESQELAKKGKKWHWWDVVLRPAAIFLLLYFRDGGFREGFRGYFLSVYRAFYSFMTYARLYELEIQGENRE